MQYKRNSNIQNKYKANLYIKEGRVSYTINNSKEPC